MNGMRMQIKRRQGGLTLIEIMVALALSAILLSGVAALFVEMRHSSRVERSLGEIQSGGRYSILQMARELRMAGYYGCNVSGTVINTLTDPSAYAFAFDTPVEGHDFASAGTWNPALPTTISSLSPPPDDNSDILTIRSISPDSTNITAHPGGSPPGSAALIVGDITDLQQFDIVLAMACPNAAAFQITNSNFSAVGLVHNTGLGTPGNATSNLQSNFTGGQLAKISTKTYFVRTDASGVPGLWMVEANNAPVELVSGVEALRVQYGEDTDGDGLADTYVDADAVGDWSDVMSVSLALLVRASQENITTAGGQQSIAFEGANYGTDGRLRKIFRNTVALRNRLP